MIRNDADNPKRRENRHDGCRCVEQGLRESRGSPVLAKATSMFTTFVALLLVVSDLGLGGWIALQLSFKEDEIVDACH